MPDATPAADPEHGHNQVAGAPSDNTTLTAVLDGLRDDGYGAELRAIGSVGEVRCGSCGAASLANYFTDVVERRLEGASDPADMVLAIGARCPACGERGAMTLGYGPIASEADSAVVLLIPSPASLPSPKEADEMSPKG